MSPGMLYMHTLVSQILLRLSHFGELLSNTSNHEMLDKTPHVTFLWGGGRGGGGGGRGRGGGGGGGGRGGGGRGARAAMEL